MSISWRPDREQTFMQICHALRKRSTCTRGKVGCVIVRGGRIVATGYNGAPPGAPHCSEVGCDVPPERSDLGCQRAIHAEANTIAFAGRAGVAVESATLICTHGPCYKCAQLIVSAGIRRVVYELPYRLPQGLELLEQVNIPYEQFFWQPEPQSFIDGL